MGYYCICISRDLRICYFLSLNLNLRKLRKIIEISKIMLFIKKLINLKLVIILIKYSFFYNVKIYTVTIWWISKSKNNLRINYSWIIIKTLKYWNSLKGWSNGFVKTSIIRQCSIYIINCCFGAWKTSLI